MGLLAVRPLAVACDYEIAMPVSKTAEPDLGLFPERLLPKSLCSKGFCPCFSMQAVALWHGHGLCDADSGAQKWK